MAVELINEDSVVSLKDVMEEEQELQDTANAVLGDSDDTNCTYPKGYVTRQALYACGTCSKGSSIPAGICLACSLHCHEGHDLYELYTKRHFRCDCGNDHFPGKTCQLCPSKDPENKENLYNHNFSGLYCTCNRPYPDIEDEIEDEMIQCLVCEDWYHTRHLGVCPPDSYEEMICDKCMSSLPFLRCYQIHSIVNETNTSVNISMEDVSFNDTFSDSKTEIDTTPETETSTTSKTETSTIPETETSTIPETETSTTSKTETSTISKAETGTTKAETSTTKAETSTTKAETSTTKAETGITKAETSITKAETGTTKAETNVKNGNSDHQTTNHLNTETCVLEKRSQYINESGGRVSGPGYFLANWRSELCHCSKCVQLYNKLNVTYLTDVNDSVKSYEERGDKAKYIHEAGLEVLGSSMSHVQQVEMIHGYNHMKEELSKFLKSFANSGKVVRSRDINDFFGELQNQKRRRLENGEGVPPDSCK